MIDISQWLIDLGVVSLGTHPIGTQYDFYKNVEWSDGTFTHNQKQFYDKVGVSRYEHFKQYGNERQFYKDISVPVIYDFYTFYKYAQDYIVFYQYLLDNYSGAAAAYSLEKLSSNYTGDAIEVRRDSDNTILDIGFDGNELDVTALDNFCNTSVQTYQSDFSVSEDFAELNGTGTINETIGGVNDAYKFELINGLNQHQTRLIAVQESTNVTLTFDYYIPSTNAIVNSIRLYNGSASANYTQDLTVIDSWTSVSFTFDVFDSVLRFFAFDGTNISVNADGDVFYLKNITVTQNTSNGYVTKWYDQSGNAYDAVQTVASNQPKIFDAVTGVILNNGKPSLYFDGADDYLNMNALNNKARLDTYFVATTSDTFSMYPTDFSVGFRFGFVSESGSSSTLLNQVYGSPSLYVNNQLFTGTTRNDIFNALNGNKLVVHQNAVTTGWANYVFGSYSAGVSYRYVGYLNELIAYDSDQSSNRVGIENNINDRYNIY